MMIMMFLHSVDHKTKFFIIRYEIFLPHTIQSYLCIPLLFRFNLYPLYQIRGYAFVPKRF